MRPRRKILDVNGRAKRCAVVFTAAVVSVAVSGCGSEEPSELSGSPSSTSVPTSQCVGADEWCDAITRLAAAQPAGTYSTDEHEVAYLAYAEAADAAALAAPEDAEVFTKLAVASRVSAADAGDPRQADLYGEIAADLFAIAARAERDCGISFD